MLALEHVLIDLDQTLPHPGTCPDLDADTLIFLLDCPCLQQITIEGVYLDNTGPRLLETSSKLSVVEVLEIAQRFSVEVDSERENKVLLTLKHVHLESVGSGADEYDKDMQRLFEMAMVDMSVA